jgi:hypothetical protein
MLSTASAAVLRLLACGESCVQQLIAGQPVCLHASGDTKRCHLQHLRLSFNPLLFVEEKSQTPTPFLRQLCAVLAPACNTSLCALFVNGNPFSHLQIRELAATVKLNPRLIAVSALRNSDTAWAKTLTALAALSRAAGANQACQKRLQLNWSVVGLATAFCRANAGSALTFSFLPLVPIIKALLGKNRYTALVLLDES